MTIGITHPLEGWSISHRTSEWLDAGSTTVLRDTMHQLQLADGQVDMWTLRTQVPLLSASDYHGLFVQAGFQVSSYTGYNEQRKISADTELACHVGYKSSN